jgi:hypothetical protein
MRVRGASWLAVALTLVGAEAGAQTINAEAAQGALVYEPAFFAQYAPQTALDMVRRVPGFTLNEGEERRGFSASVGNVLIDGAVPAGKSEDLEELLERIPAGDVVRLELVRGAGANAAQSMRLNIVRRPSSGEGVWLASLERTEDQRVSPAARASWSSRRGAIEYGLSGGFELSHLPSDGFTSVTDAVGALEETERERLVENEEEARLAGEVTMPFNSGALTLTASLSREDGRERQSVWIHDNAGALDETETVVSREVEDIGEVSATHRRELGAWSLELGALATRRWADEDESAVERDALGAFDEAEQQTRSVEAGESVARFGLSRGFRDESELRLTAEVALNTLEQRFALTEDTGAGPTPVVTPGANMRIEETRAEASIGYSWRPA